MAIETPQFGGFLGGVLAAQDRRQQILERDRQNAAYQSFIETYGPGGAEPNALATLSAMARLNERQPLELEALGLGNEGARQGIDQSAELFPITKRQAELGNVQINQNIGQSAARFPLEQQARMLGNTGLAIGNTAAQDKVTQGRELFPRTLAAADLGNEATRQGIDQGREMFPRTLAAADIGNAGAQQTVDQSAARFPLEQESRVINNTAGRIGTTAAQRELEAADVARKRQALTSGVRLLTAVRDQGGDLNMAFDRLVPTLKSMGIPDGELVKAKQLILQDPKSLDAIAASLTEPAKPGSREAGDGLTEGQKYNQREVAKLAAKAEADVFDREAANTRAVTNIQASAVDVKTAVDQLLQPKNLESAFGWSSLAAAVPGSGYADAAAQLDTVKAKVMVNVVSAIKEASVNGATGFGALSDTEGKRLTDAMGALNPLQSPEEAKRTLTEIKTASDALVTKARKVAEDDNKNAAAKAKALFERVDGRAPAAAPNGAPAAAPAAPANGAPVRVNTPQEAAALPSGTRFVTPDGRVKVKP